MVSAASLIRRLHATGAGEQHVRGTFVRCHRLLCHLYIGVEEGSCGVCVLFCFSQGLRVCTETLCRTPCFCLHGCLFPDSHRSTSTSRHRKAPEHIQYKRHCEKWYCRVLQSLPVRHFSCCLVYRRMLTGYAQTNCSTLVLCSSTEIDHCPFALPHVMTITSATQKTKLAGVVFDERQDIVAVDTAPTIDLWPRTKDAAARADASWVCSWIAFRLSVTYSVSWTGFGTELCSTLFY